MPHFGLMNTEDSFNSAEGALLRARLHIRAGKRRLRQGKISAGILTLYDALLFAMDSYVYAGETIHTLSVQEGEDMRDDKTLYRILVRSGVLDGSFDYASLDKLVDEASNKELVGFAYRPLIEELEGIMTKLNVMPFDEGSLPPEDPATF